MSVYTQQINTIVEQFPVIDQRFILEFVTSYRKNNDLKKEKPIFDEALHKRQQEAVKIFIEGINSVEPLEDDEIDEILIRGISLRTPEELDLL